jgi:hypothetical protein
VDHTVFIHTNHKQIVGALVAEHAFKRNSAHTDKFDVRLIKIEDYPFFQAHEGDLYLRDGVKRPWLNDDLQSFTPLRFMPPELMQYRGRAVVVDPDIFALGDVWELLSRDMGDRAVLCRRRAGPKGYIDKCWASSVMLLDCGKLRHWKVEEQFNAMFELRRDYQQWICLKLEDPSRIGLLEDEWNDFDKLTARTKMLHTTRRRTQPWKAGLPIDWRPAEKFRLFPPLGWAMRARRKVFGEYGLLGKYKTHPDPNQERLFFGLLRECLEQGKVSEDLLREEMAKNHVRHDAFEVLERTEPLAPSPGPMLPLPPG